MKSAARNVLLTVAFASIAAFGMLAYIRLAPSDPSVWHFSPLTSAVAGPGTCLASIIALTGGARAVCRTAQDPSAVLASLDAAALSTPVPPGWPDTRNRAASRGSAAQL